MKRDRFRSLALPALVVAIAAAALAPALEAQPRNAVTIYAGGDYRGASETLYGDVPDMRRTRVGNDQASSVRVAPGCTVVLYAGGDYQGRSMALDRDLRSLAGTEVGNDAVSSLRLRCGTSSGGGPSSGGRGVALYRDAGFTGWREVFYGDDSDLRNNRIGAGAASSVRVDQGCRATLFSEPGYRGRSVEFGDDVRNLGETRLGNDAAASLRVRCDDHRDDPWSDRGDDRRGGSGGSGGSGGWNPWGTGTGTGTSTGTGRGGGGATLYAGGDYSGRSETFLRDVENLHGTAVGNDTVSSVRVDPGCRLVLFEHPDFRGHSTVLDRDEPDMRRTSLGNDRASSLRIECGRRGDRYGGGYRDDDRRSGRGVTLYRDADFRGRGETFNRDVRDLTGTEVGNDAARSVRVDPGCRAVLYRHSDYRGESIVLTRDAESLRYTAIGNDAVSSIEVDCR